ncbi:queuosine precursor transporter [Facklamia hominis]|uniref:queuosine precursor transporter n=1 Tax=Facklamia hominis TaxID=178214 RepID=UPI00101D4C3F|nr:queuosine precursor transporter [Facklamia hominis]RYC97751.1 VUT family protein [Facklamia hominis]
MKKQRLLTLLPLLYAAYASSLLAMNLLATKQFDLWQFTVTTGILVSPIAFIIQDLATEVFGFRIAKRMILTGFVILIVASLVYQLAILIPPSNFWSNQAAFASILSTTLRISLASLTAYLVGSLVNAKIMDQLKRSYPDSLFFRAITSTIFGQLLDNLLFAFLAFWGVLPLSALISMVIGGTLFETIYEIVLYPLTRLLIRLSQNYLGDEIDAI